MRAASGASRTRCCASDEFPRRAPSKLVTESRGAAPTSGGENEMTTATGTTQVHEVEIRASAAQIWAALTSSEWTQRYGYGGSVEYDLRPGGVYRAFATAEMLACGAPEVVVEGEVIVADAPRRFEQTWHALVRLWLSRRNRQAACGSRSRRRGATPRGRRDATTSTARRSPPPSSAATCPRPAAAGASCSTTPARARGGSRACRIALVRTVPGRCRAPGQAL